MKFLFGKRITFKNLKDTIQANRNIIGYNIQDYALILRIAI